MSAVQYRFIDKRRIPTNLEELLKDKIDDVQKSLYSKMAAKIVEFSPVDTGTYMDNHTIGVGRSSAAATASSNGKPRKQSRGPYESAALSRMLYQINALPNNPGVVFIGNFAVHASFVEHGGPNWTVAYSPYRRARAMSAALLNEAVAEVGAL